MKAHQVSWSRRVEVREGHLWSWTADRWVDIRPAHEAYLQGDLTAAKQVLEGHSDWVMAKEWMDWPTGLPLWMPITMMTFAYTVTDRKPLPGWAKTWKLRPTGAPPQMMGDEYARTDGWHIATWMLWCGVRRAQSLALRQQRKLLGLLYGVGWITPERLLNCGYTNSFWKVVRTTVRPCWPKRQEVPEHWQ